MVVGFVLYKDRAGEAWLRAEVDGNEVDADHLDESDGAFDLLKAVMADPDADAVGDGSEE